MDFGALANSKRKVLIDFVATISRLLTRHGNHVGAIFYGTGVSRRIPARSGRLQVLRLLNDLLQQPSLPQSPFTDLTPMLRAAMNSIKRRSLIFVMSDFICEPGWESALSLMNQHHEVIAVHLWDLRETQLPDIGPLLMQDAETGEQLYVDTRDAKFRARFKAASENREAQMAASFKHAGVDVLSLSTEEDMVRAIVRFASLREGRRR
jgi:uncharacterized protein (DUF58 family)